MGKEATTTNKSNDPKEKKFKDVTSSRHWLNNLGYALYAGVGAIKQVGVFQKAVANDNPTLMLGLTTLLASYPPVFFSHDLYAKLLMMIAFHLSEMAESGSDYNTFVGKMMNKGKAEGIALNQPTLTGLPGMKSWLTKEYTTRLATGKATPEDKVHFKQFWAYVARDQQNAFTHLGESFQALGELGVESVKTLGTLGKHTFKLPNKLNIWPKAKPSEHNLNARQNIYHFENAGAFAGLLGVLGETAGHTLGVHQYTRFLTVPWLMSANLMQTIGFGASSKAIWDMGKERKFKLMGASEGVGTLMCAIGAASWSNDTLLGIYRAGSALRTPFRMHQRLNKMVDGKFVQMTASDLDKTARTALRWDWISLVVDIASAAAIIGSPFVAAYELKHHTDLKNPKNWGKVLKGKKETPPHHVAVSPALKNA